MLLGVTDFRLTHKPRVPAMASNSSFCRDGSLLSVINGGNQVAVWNTATGRQVCKATGHWSTVLSTGWSVGWDQVPCTIPLYHCTIVPLYHTTIVICNVV